jgi:hypothetical protein
LDTAFIIQRREIHDLGRLRLPLGANTYNFVVLLVDLAVFRADVLLLFDQRIKHFVVALMSVLSNIQWLLLSESSDFEFEKRAVVVPDKASLDECLTQLEHQVLSDDRNHKLERCVCWDFPNQVHSEVE